MKLVSSIDEKDQEKLRLLRMCEGITALRKNLSSFRSAKAKVDYVKGSVGDRLHRFPQVRDFLTHANDEERLVLLLILALEQADTVFANLEKVEDISASLHKLAQFLLHTERFYSDIGGLAGYHEAMLRLFIADDKEQIPELFSPPYFDLKEESQRMWKYSLQATERLGEMGEVFTVGGAGERLGLVNEKTGDPIPVARLVFCGLTLLDGLFRDLEGREYWHYKLCGKRMRVPVVLMTSQEKNNDQLITEMMEKAQWYGRPKESIFKVMQPLAPLATRDGFLACSAPLEIMGKPGGHGVIWKLAADEGVFAALKKKGITSLLVRQINNPLAGLDYGLLSLQGVGLVEGKSFGFAGCPPRPGFAEGLIALVIENSRRGRKAHLSNIEYTKFESVRKQNPALLEEGGVCPANTNILFANIEAIEKALSHTPVPGMVVNAKTGVEVVDGEKKSVKTVARLESTMQNIADAMGDFIEEDIAHSHLSTFVNLYERGKVMSVTKCPCESARAYHESPISAFYDWYCTMYRLLKKECMFDLPLKQTIENFIAEGPSFLFFFHPALGPLWKVISQKVSGGRVAWGSEIELEIAELHLQDFFVRGSFRLLSDYPTGCRDEDGCIQFTPDVPRAFLRNVCIENQGIVPASLAAHIDRRVSRHSSCTIRLEGASELIAEDIVIRGDFSLTVADGKRARLYQTEDGGVGVFEEELRHPSWHYSVGWREGEAPKIVLTKE